MIISLNGKWNFKELGTDNFLSATVPGCNYLDLINNQLITDPFYGTNEKDCYWVCEKDWLYALDFETSNELLSHDRIDLVCESLDTIADIYLNGTLIKSVNNCHIKYIIDIKSYIKEKNHIEIIFHSPVNYVKACQSKEKCPHNFNGVNGIPHIRKPQCHFGWDWGPVLTPSGISGNIFLQGHNVARIKSADILQRHLENKVELDISGIIDNFGGKKIKLEIEIIYPNGDKHKDIIETMDEFNLNTCIEKPELWHTREFSDLIKQPLYSINIKALRNGIVLDKYSKKIGLRTIELDQSIDEYGKNFQFILNGNPVFAKGANWIPADSFINRVDKTKLEYYIRSAVDSNFNMLRIWGGGYYESDEFYDLCDEYGILVWQDFGFACQPYPFFDELLLNNIFDEVEYNVIRLRNHACLCLWCGNNEIEAMSIAWRNKAKYIKWTEKFFYDLLPKQLRKYDNTTPYICGTPCGISHNKGVNSDNVGDTHLWAVWHGLQPLTYYRKRLTRFCSEFGFESLPDLKTIETFAELEDYSLTSDVFSNHQKCLSGNAKMVYYISKQFRLPLNFTDYIYLSGICQQECIKDATEHWRRNKGMCNGSLFWQLNDCWPVCSWSSIDYYGNYKALQYTAKHFFSPLEVSIEDSKKKIAIHLINDKLQSFEVLVKLRLISFDGEECFSKDIVTSAQALSARLLEVILVKDLKKIADLKQCVFVADMYIEGNRINRKSVLFDKVKNIDLPKTAVNTAITVENDKAIYTITSDKYIRFLQLASRSNMLPFSDNYFDLLPNETVVITQQLEELKSVKFLREDLTLFSVRDIVPKASKFSDFIIRMKIFLTPINFLSWIINKIVPRRVSRKAILKQESKNKEN